MTNYRKIDLPQGVRRALIALGVLGAILVATGSLIGVGRGSIEIDKLIHFSAYTCISIVLVLGLPFRFSIFGLLLVALASYGVEYLQPFNGRTGDFFDAIANTTGICIGAGLGLGARWLSSRLWSEFQELRMQRNLRSWNAGEAVFSEGETLKHFWVIKTGTVQVTNPSGVVELGPGDVLGLRSELLNLPSTETAITLSELVAWELDVEKMVEESGGPDQPLAIILKALMKQDQEENEISV
jgi:hypothetical protein